MSDQPVSPRALPRKLESSLNKVKHSLNELGLVNVLDSFPPATSFAFRETEFQGKNAIKLHLGHRRQLDNTLAESWAYIILEQYDKKPPVMIQDEAPSMIEGNEKPRRWPRPASSLLRKARDLFPPFSFLQTNAGANPRNKLCALILYYSLVNGLADTATRWGFFEDSLIEALSYIEYREEYQLWRDEQVNDPDKILSETSEAEQDDDSDASQKKGGVVRSTGSSVSVKPGTSLAKLKDVLGYERAQLFDAIPPIPVTIERHDNDAYWPFRLHLGMHGNTNVYVYLKHGWRTDCKIISHESDNETQQWKFSDLSELQLFKPFSCFMQINQNLATRGNKVRYLVYYYFMLAENEGFIDSPQLEVTMSSMITSFCAACKNLEDAGYENDAYDEVQDQSQADKGISSLAKQSFIMRLQVQPEVLAILNETADVRQRLHSADSAEDSPRSATNEEASRRPHAPSSHAQIFSVHVESPPVQDWDASHNVPVQSQVERVNIPPGNVHGTEEQEIETRRDSSRDSVFQSSNVSKASLPEPAADCADADEHRRLGQNVVEVAGRALGQPVHDDDGELPLMLPDPDVKSPSPGNADIIRRYGSVLSISSNGDIEATGITATAGQPPTKTDSPPPTAVGLPPDFNIIDLCSDDKDSVLAGSVKSEIDRTPDIQEPSGSRQLKAQDYDDDELRWPSQKRKRDVIEIASIDDNEDEVLEEINGNAWRSASLRQSQVKRHDSDD